jgi:hypothetical protein
MMETAACQRSCGWGRKKELSAMGKQTHRYKEANGGIFAIVCW